MRMDEPPRAGGVHLRSQYWEEAAKEARRWFKRADREDRRGVWTLKDGRPDTLWYAVMEAHRDLLPDDHVYAFFKESLASFEEEGEGASVPDADYLASDLYRWLASHGTRSALVDEALAEAFLMRKLEAPCLVDLLQEAQARERHDVHTVVETYLRRAVEEAKLAEEDEPCA